MCDLLYTGEFNRLRNEIDGLIIIGGNVSCQGALDLSKGWRIPCKGYLLEVMGRHCGYIARVCLNSPLTTFRNKHGIKDGGFEKEDTRCI